METGCWREKCSVGFGFGGLGFRWDFRIFEAEWVETLEGLGFRVS